MVSKLDSFLLDLCTRFSHWLQRTTGLTNFFIAKIGVALVVLNMVVWLLNYLHRFLIEPTSTGTLFFVGPIVFFAIWRSLALAKAEERLLSDTPAIDRMLMSSLALRLVWMFFLAQEGLIFGLSVKRMHHIVLEIFGGLGWSFGMVIFSYFVAVHPMPPGKSRLREFVDSIGLRKAIPVPAEN